MNAFSARPTTNSLKRKKAPGEAEFLALFQLIPGPALLLENPQARIVQANSAMLQLTAFSLSEIAGRELRQIAAGLPEHELLGEELLAIALERRGRPPLPVNVHLRPLDPSGGWLVLTIETVEKQRAQIRQMEQVSETLAELNRIDYDQPAEHNLARGLASIQRLTNATALAIYQVGGPDGQVERVAQAGEAGLLPEVIPAADLLRLGQTFPWKPGRRVQTELHRQARVNNLNGLTSTPLRHNGLLVIADRRQEPDEPLLVTAQAMAGQIDDMLDHLQQVGGLYRRLDDLQRELTIWRGVGEHAQDGILLLAPDLTVTHINPAAEWMLGYAAREVKGNQVANILIGPDRLAPVLETALQGIGTHNLGSVSLHRRSGQSFPAHVMVMPIEQEGQVLAILVFFRDVSEHMEIRNLTQQLEQRAILGEFSSVFAHEVRNPINNISTGLQLLAVMIPPDDPNQENIERLLNDCTRLEHLMESVLSFSRQTVHKFQDLDLEWLLRNLLDRYRPRMEKINVSAHFGAAPGTPHAWADPRTLEQVFANLVSNALEAMTEKGGTLAIHIAPHHKPPARPQVEITISDTGPGIPDEVRERIFEPFVTTKPQGTGLGLAITKRIVTAHHGSMSVNSFPGGTVFHVYLPVNDQETPGGLPN